MAVSEDVTGPYVDRYFAELPDTVKVRSGWMLADAAQYFFPRTSLDEATLASARRRWSPTAPWTSPCGGVWPIEAAELERLLSVARAFPR